MVGWINGCMDGWSVRRLVGWLVGWFLRSVVRSFGRSVGQTSESESIERRADRWNTPVPPTARLTRTGRIAKHISHAVDEQHAPPTARVGGDGEVAGDDAPGGGANARHKPRNQ